MADDDSSLRNPRDVTPDQAAGLTSGPLDRIHHDDRRGDGRLGSGRFRGSRLEWLGTLAAWLSMALAVVTMAVAIFDFGGVLPWTHWAIAMGITLSAGLSLLTIGFGRPHVPRRSTLATAGLVVMVGWMIVQSADLPAPVDSLLRTGRQEISGFDAAPSISIRPQATLHLAAMGWIAATAMATALVVVQTDLRVRVMLSAIATLGVGLALVGLVPTVSPHLTVTGHHAASGGYPFGTFVNRSNAALVLNLAFAAGIALLMTRAARSAKRSQFRNHATTIHYPQRSLWPMLPALMAVATIGVGILATGSRGGMAAAVVGISVTTALMTRRATQHLLPIMGIAAAAVLAVVLLALALGVEADGWQRISQTQWQRDSATERTDAAGRPARYQTAPADPLASLNEGRLRHWPDAIRAATAFAPAGSGGGTYRHAYLPFQETSPDAWFQHADNLWLEWWVEWGWLGGLAMLAAGVLIVRTLWLGFGDSSTLHVGLVAGLAYAATAVLVSQSFDFGLLWPSGFLPLGLLFAAASRSLNDENRRRIRRTGPERRRRTRLRPGWARTLRAQAEAIGRLGAIARERFDRWQRWARHPVSPLTLGIGIGVMVGGSVIATGHLAGDAGAAGLISLVAQHHPIDEPDRWNDLLAEMDLQIQQRRRDTDLKAARIRAAMKSVRARVARELAITGDRSETELYQSVTISSLRQAAADERVRRATASGNDSVVVLDRSWWYQQGVDGEALNELRHAKSLAREITAIEPLSIVGHGHLVLLDFADPAPQSVRQANTRRWLRLQIRSSKSLEQIGLTALAAGDTTLAADAFRRCTDLDVNCVYTVLKTIEGRNDLQVNDCIGRSEPALVAAAMWTLQRIDGQRREATAENSKAGNSASVLSSESSDFRLLARSVRPLTARAIAEGSAAGSAPRESGKAPPHPFAVGVLQCLVELGQHADATRMAQRLSRSRGPNHWETLATVYANHGMDQRAERTRRRGLISVR